MRMSAPGADRSIPWNTSGIQNGYPSVRNVWAVIRPKVLLFGEQVDNQMMTRAVDEISKAQVLLLLGTAIHSGLCERYVKYFRGERLILINGVEHYTDERADIVLHEEVKTALPKIVWPRQSLSGADLKIRIRKSRIMTVKKG